MKTLLTILFSTAVLSCFSQTKVSGTIKDSKGHPLTGVNVYFKNTYNGASSDSTGYFSVETNEENPILVAQFIGYKNFESEIHKDTSTLSIVLKESSSSIAAVTITAGSFAATDESKAAVLKPLDIYTTAGSLGNIVGALTTLPGTQPANDDGRLLVRGGEASETKTVIDGLLAGKPYFAKVPDLPTRGRFSPSLFSGTTFNTGGYSAEYGQALSSVLVLNSNGIATKDLFSYSITSVGTDLSYAESWKNNSLSVTGAYTNLAPYYQVANNNNDWTKPTEAFEGDIIYRHKTQSSGLLKAYVTSNHSQLKFNSQVEQNNEEFRTKLTNTNTYGNISFIQPLGRATVMKTGISITADHPNILYGSQSINTNEINLESRVSFINEINHHLKLNYGISSTYTNYNQNYRAHPDSSLHQPSYKDNITALYFEGEVNITKNMSLRPGVRYEYSSVLGKSNISPRIAFAISTGKHSQISASYGHFYQNPQSDILKFNTDMDYEKATHYILGFQSGDVNSRLFRIEGYYKKYSQLVTYTGTEYYLAEHYNNNGKGYAQGLDLFWRDSKSISHLDYWISYSYIDTKRKYKSFEIETQPDYISTNTLSLVGKYFISAINCQVGASYWLASGRKWYEENNNQNIAHQGKSTDELSLNISYLTNIFNQPAVLHFAVSNVLGKNNIYGYRQSPIANQEGNYYYTPIQNDIKSFVFLGLFINLNY